jgi:shikimate kinase
VVTALGADEHLVLIGMMGTGKTTVGTILADRLHRRLLDSDEEIEARTGHTVREIFERQGEPAFRALETEVLEEALHSRPPAVIAAAGGVVLSERNREALRTAPARVVWLCADPARLVDRAQRGVHRPLLDDDPAGTLQRMWDERHELYRSVADATVAVDDRTPDEVAEAVLE